MIDKNKAYRFRGDSERWVWTRDERELYGVGCGHPICWQLADSFHERGILLEYPELPGDDWEFCEAESAELWHEGDGGWFGMGYSGHGTGIYCRKKNPVITEVEAVVGTFLYEPCVPLPVGFAGPGDRVRVTKL